MQSRELALKRLRPVLIFTLSFLCCLCAQDPFRPGPNLLVRGTHCCSVSVK